ELSEAQWERIKDTLPGRMEYVGRTAADEAGVASGLPIMPGQAAEYAQALILLDDQQAQATQSHRMPLQSPQTLPPLQRTLLHNHQSLLLPRRPRLHMAQTSAICGYDLLAT
ncbi:MAG: hypothetical protein ACRYFU_26580, partial [Janthinobacterium lividum]